jgi:hypothetical protein
MPSTEQLGGHTGNPKKPIFNEILALNLAIFDESGFGVRKPCIGGKVLERH